MKRPLVALILAVSFYMAAAGSDACFQKEAPGTLKNTQNPCWQKASTQSAMNQCAADDLRHADAELNATYQKVLSKYSNDPKQIARIKKAAAWLAFRDAEIEALFPESSRSGSVSTMCGMLQLARLITERTKALKAMFEHEEGDVCAP